MLGGILKQVASGLERIPQEIETAFHMSKKQLGGRELESAEILKLLISSLRALKRSYICIDALDECIPKHLLELLKSLKSILQESHRTRIFFTGRPQVGGEIAKYFITCVIVPISPKEHDIVRYLENKLEMDTECNAMSDGLRADILRIVTEKISEMCVEASPIPTP